MKITDEAVKAAWTGWICEIDPNSNMDDCMRAALTAALPHLQPVDVAAVRRQALEEAEHVVGSTVLKHIASDYDGMTSLEAYEAGQMNGMTCALDAIRALSAEPAQGEQLKRIGFIDHFSMMAIKHGADFSEITISKAAIDTHIYPIYAAPTTEAGR